MCTDDKCFKEKRDAWFTIMPLAVFLFLVANILCMAQTGVGTETDPCKGLDRTECTGITQPCMKWTGRACNTTVSIDNGRTMCSYKAKQCKLNLNWFNKEQTWKRDLPGICKITERGESQEIGSSASLLMIFSIGGIILSVGYVAHVIWAFVLSVYQSNQCQITLHQLFTGLIILYSIIMVALEWSYSLALVNDETGCLIIDDDRDGWEPWPDNDANPYGQYFQEIYFKGVGVLGMLIIARVVFLLSIGLFSFQLFYLCSNRGDILGTSDINIDPKLFLQGRSKRTFT